MKRKIDWAQVQEKIEPWLRGNRRVWLTAAGFAGIVALIRLLGVLETLELAALDQLVRFRQSEQPNDRIVLVYIDDSDIAELGTWPIPDGIMASALEAIKQESPRAIGLDIYRDLPVGEGTEELEEVFATTPNLIGIEKRTDRYATGVRPPAILEERNQIGFNDVLLDDDGRVRRALLFTSDEDGFYTSFALKLAQIYLAEEGITPHGANRGNPRHLQLGDAIFRPLEPNDGAYVGIDNGGYQIITNFHSNPDPFKSISFTNVLNGDIPEGLMRDRIVLIGSNAKSLQDFFYTPLSEAAAGNQLMPGVKLHAHFINQVIGAAMDRRELIRVWPDPAEYVWILVWSILGASLSWRVRSPIRGGILLVLFGAALIVISIAAFTGGWWIPVVPPLIALVGSAVGITSYLAHLEGELQKSKEFLNSVINTIPDPIFVKDKNHQWIVLNEAYSRFIGYPMDTLLGKDERTFLPAHQADALHQQEKEVFEQTGEQEREGEFTGATGHKYIISTKRSLHKDSAGNLFLVGVIHDITQRKRMEEELRRTAAELVQSNAELRQTGAHLKQMAYHDSLTGLPNRKLFQERLIQSIEWAEYNNQLIALLFLDLDGFKAINDSEGHVVGDLVLKAVAKRLSGSLRSSDTVARLGGDEFVVILPAIPSQQKAGQVAQKLLATLSESFVIQGKTIEITTSIGISMYPFDGASIETLIVEADQAMYRAKERGKDCFVFTSKTDVLPEGNEPIEEEEEPLEISVNE